jgi:hypothetical protein
VYGSWKEAASIRSALAASIASPTQPFPAATPSNSRHHLPEPRYFSKACLRSAYHCSHSAGTYPGATSSTRVAGDPHAAHCGAATIPTAMEVIVVLPEALRTPRRTPADCADPSRSHRLTPRCHSPPGAYTGIPGSWTVPPLVPGRTAPSSSG